MPIFDRAFAIFPLAFAFANPAASTAEPNVVFILSDDQSWTDFGLMDHPHIKTPNIDRFDLREPDQLARRNRVFVDVYQHDSDIHQLDDLTSGLDARVIIDGWDKLIANKGGVNELYDLENDDDDRNDLSSQNKEKVNELATIIDTWLTHKD